ncbi:grainyhead-like [Apophysomyces sp. BC1015]|nr:grainyhead-like [Apophysomyces sp. BC1015]
MGYKNEYFHQRSHTFPSNPSVLTSPLSIELHQQQSHFPLISPNQTPSPSGSLLQDQLSMSLAYTPTSHFDQSKMAWSSTPTTGYSDDNLVSPYTHASAAVVQCTSGLTPPSVGSMASVGLDNAYAFSYGKRCPTVPISFDVKDCFHARQASTGSYFRPPQFFSAPTSDAMLPQTEETLNLQLRFNVILQTPTAAAQRIEDSPITYLNRGQAYAVQLRDRQNHKGTITSTFALMFHDPSHRKVALNYWKFWISQQKNPEDARAIDLDSSQSTGIHNVQFPSFDRITFEWNGSQGAKIFVRFNCLSTDFSRIKGVKGIPLRAYMESKVPCSSILDYQLAGTVQSKSDDAVKEQGLDGDSYEYAENCFCKIKLFRDKGAERKNKDDAKQISKQLKKIMAEGNPRQHPLWLTYNQPAKPYSVFSEIPSSPTLKCMDELEAQLTSASSNTAYPSNTYTSPSPGGMTYPYAYSPLVGGSSPTNTPSVDQNDALALVTSFPWPSGGVKRSHTDSQILSHGSGSPTESSKRQRKPLCLYVDIKTTQHQRFHSPKSPSSSSSSSLSGDKNQRLKCILLERLTVQELITKLSSTLSLHPSQVSEVLWRRPKSATEAMAAKHAKNNHDVLILVEDAVLAQHFPDNTVMAVEWEIKSDGTVRLLLQF